VRIAFTSSHRCGKSTLVAKVAEQLGNHDVVEEPYVQLEEEGHEFAHPRSAASRLDLLVFVPIEDPVLYRW
jgi:hypothetical protein